MTDIEHDTHPAARSEGATRVPTAPTAWASHGR